MKPSPFPIISLKKLSDSLDNGGEEIQNLRNISLDDGFFYLTDHGISDEKINRAIKAARRFFHLNIKEKMKYAQDKQLIWPKTARGYIPLHGEMFDPEMGPGCHEAFNVGIENPPSDLPFTGPNTWPPEELAPELKKSMLDIQSIVLHEISPILISSFALALGMDKNFFRSHFQNLILDQGANFYPPGEGTIGKHTDSGFFTLLIQEQLQQSSLRVYTRGKWIDAPPIPEYGEIDENAEEVKAAELMLKNHEAVWVKKKGQGRIDELEIDTKFDILNIEK